MTQGREWNLLWEDINRNSALRAIAQEEKERQMQAVVDREHMRMLTLSVISACLAAWFIIRTITYLASA